MAKLGLKLNVKRRALSQYENYDFSSMTVFNGKPIAINEDGVYEIFTGNSDNGKNIDAYFDLPETNLGLARNKRIRDLIIGCSVSGSLAVTVEDDEGGSYTYQVAPTKIGKQHFVRTTLGRNWHKGCYYSIRIGNVNGSYFDIDFIQAKPILLSRRPARF